MNALSSLMPIPYQTIDITYGSINYFDKSTKENNDEYNKSREYIIGAVIHDAIHKDYIYSRRWNRLRQPVQSYINILCDKPYIIDTMGIILNFV